MNSHYSPIDPYNSELKNEGNLNVRHINNRLLDNGNGGYAAMKRHYYDSPLSSHRGDALQVIRMEKETEIENQFKKKMHDDYMHHVKQEKLLF
jgi:hypothetical protein